MEKPCLELPDALKPSCWNDQPRMDALFAPFRSRALNPTDWDSKMKFWRDVIEAWLYYFKLPLFDMLSLKDGMRRNGRCPACLDTVIDHLLREKLIFRQSEVVSTSESWGAWAVTVLKYPLSWAANKLKRSQSEGVELLEQYVHEGVVKRLGADLVNCIPQEFIGKLITLEEIMTHSCIKVPNHLHIILLSLRKQKKLSMKSVPIGTVLYKFKNQDDPKVEISELELNVYMLKHNSNNLLNKIQLLEKDKETAVGDAKKYISKNMKPMALSCLRKKKELEKFIEKKVVALDNLQSLIFKIEQTESDAEIIQSYKIGTMTLKEMLKDHGLTETAVTGVMDDLEDVLDIHKEIESTISRPIESELDQELEDELNELLLDDAPGPPPHDGGLNNSLEKQMKDLHIDGLPELPPIPVSALCLDPVPVVK